MTGLEFLGESYDISRPASGMMTARVARNLGTRVKMPTMLGLHAHFSATETDQAKLILRAKKSIYHQGNSLQRAQSMSRLTTCAIYRQASWQHEGDRAKPSKLNNLGLW